MNDRLTQVVQVIQDLDAVHITSPFRMEGDVIVGAIQIEEQSAILTFSVSIYAPYPLRFHDAEMINFVNNDLLEYNHVNADGSICIHNLHSTDLSEKIRFDFVSLREWIVKYYIERKTDDHYEHIIVPRGVRDVYLFTHVDHAFKKGEFGELSYSDLSTGRHQSETIKTRLVQGFKVNGRTVLCDWNSFYKALPKKKGAFVFLENAPVLKKRFAVDNWKDLEPFVSQEFLQFLTTAYKGNGEAIIPLLIGYKISGIEIHWQVALIDAKYAPNYGEKISGTKTYKGRLKDQSILWGETKNNSYHYFYGRGKLSKRITEANVLVIGVGAIGSMIATSLVRGGLKRLTIADHDIKEPENVCRAEYSFFTGITDKVEDLSGSLMSISPFLDIRKWDRVFDFAKFSLNDPENIDLVTKLLNEYDLIFDCSTDNDVAYILDTLKLRGEIYNLAITNEAKELVCAVSPNAYKWTLEIFKQLSSGTEELYNPTGCWSPTFRASHNDIAVLVQYALKHINNSFENGLPVRNFYLTSSFDSELKIKLTQF